jgi:hypothetical protein
MIPTAKGNPMTQEPLTFEEQTLRSYTKFLGTCSHSHYSERVYTQDGTQVIKDKICQILEEYVGFYVRNNHISNESFEGVRADSLTRLFGFSVDGKDSRLMSMYKSAEEYIKSYHTGTVATISGKPSKIIKKVFPFLSEKDCESFAIWWKDTFCLDESLFTFHSGKERKDFAKAYAGDIMKDIPSYYSGDIDLDIKSLCNSCMRGNNWNFGNGIISPAEAFASGDFVVYWIEYQDKIAARCVIRHFTIDKACAGPIYATCEKAARLIEEKITDTFKDWDYRSWQGASLLALETINGEYAVPYLDHVGAASYDYDNPGFLTVDSGGKNTSTSGKLYFEKPVVCNCCNCNIGEDSSYSDPDGNDICEDCFGEYYFVDDITWETGHIYDSCFMLRKGIAPISFEEIQVTSDTLADYGLSVEGSDSIYHKDCVIEINGLNYAMDESQGFVFRSSFAGKWFLVSEKVESNLGPVSKSEVDSLISEPAFNVSSIKDKWLVIQKQDYTKCRNGKYMQDDERGQLTEKLSTKYETIRNRYYYTEGLHYTEQYVIRTMMYKLSEKIDNLRKAN